MKAKEKMSGMYIVKTILLINLVVSLNAIEKNLNEIENKIKSLRKPKARKNNLVICISSIQQIMVTINETLEIINIET